MTVTTSTLKNSTFIVFILFSASAAFATPHKISSKAGHSKSSTTKGKSGAKGLAPTSGKSGSYYNGMNTHESAAEKQKMLDKEYTDQLQAIKEGKPLPPTTGGNKVQVLAARKAALEEKRAKHAEEIELRRLEREQKKDKRLAEAAERKAKKQERSSRGKKKSADADTPDIEKEIAKKPRQKPPEPDKLDNF